MTQTEPGTIAGHAPWPRVPVDAERWEATARWLGSGAGTLVGLWGDVSGDAAAVHMAVHDDGTPPGFRVVSLETPERRFPSVGRWHAPAIRLERAIRDLFDLEPVGAPDPRRWLDHGTWQGGPPADYAFLAVEGEDLHEISVGPVHAGVIEPGHFRFTADGETVVRLEQRLGYTHKGVERLLAGSSLSHAARLAGRVSGDSTVAYALAFARAAEAAARVEPPPRAIWLRALMAELERMANHLGDVGAICNDASFAIINAHCAILRERVVRAADRCFGHRLMMDRIVPGGVAVDLPADGPAVIEGLCRDVGPRLKHLTGLYDRTASLQDRTVGTGIVPLAFVRRFGCGGFIGRASGRGFDTRRDAPYPPYDRLRFEMPLLEKGDVNARIWVRIREVEASLSLIRQIMADLPAGAVLADADVGAAAAGGEGVALVEAFRGDVFAWLRVDAGGRVGRCHLRDPSWFQWPLLETAIEGNIVADFPLCNKSFNCSYSGHDL